MAANKKETSLRGNAPFVAELYDIVEAGPSDLVSWTANGQAVVIWDSERFADDVLERHFKSSNFASFVRQLNFYGFRKVNKTGKGVDPRVWEFQHVHFVRERPDLLTQIRRRSPHDNANKNDIDVLRAELDDSRSSNSALRAALVKVFERLVEAVGEQEAIHLELPDDVRDILTQSFSLFRRPEVPSIPAAEQATRESGRKRARTHSCLHDLKDLHTKATVPSADMELNRGTRRGKRIPASKPSVDEPEFKETFEFTELRVAMTQDEAEQSMQLSESVQFASPPVFDTSDPEDLSPLFRMPSFSVTGPNFAELMQPASLPTPHASMSRVPSFSSLTLPTEQPILSPVYSVACARQSVDEFFVSDIDVPSVDADGATTSLQSDGLQSRQAMDRSAACAAVGSMPRHTDVWRVPVPAQVLELTSTQQSAAVQAVAQYMFADSRTVQCMNYSSILSSPEVHDAVAMNFGPVDEENPESTLRKFVLATQPDVVLACLLPVLPHIQQIIAAVAAASISFASSFAAHVPLALASARGSNPSLLPNLG